MPALSGRRSRLPPGLVSRPGGRVPFAWARRCQQVQPSLEAVSERVQVPLLAMSSSPGCSPTSEKGSHRARSIGLTLASNSLPASISYSALLYLGDSGIQLFCDLVKCVGQRYGVGDGDYCGEKKQSIVIHFSNS